MNVGEIWIDKDKRMKSRAVKIIAIGEMYVHYSPCNHVNGWVSALKYRSRLDRFPKAFTPHQTGDSK
jgi:hypothetical protein